MLLNWFTIQSKETLKGIHEETPRAEEVTVSPEAYVKIRVRMVESEAMISKGASNESEGRP